MDTPKDGVIPVGLSLVVDNSPAGERSANRRATSGQAIPEGWLEESGGICRRAAFGDVSKDLAARRGPPDGLGGSGRTASILDMISGGNAPPTLRQPFDSNGDDYQNPLWAPGDATQGPRKQADGRFHMHILVAAGHASIVDYCAIRCLLV
jgi:hypothetical protein